MNMIYTIARRELLVNLRRPVFWLGVLLVPLIAGVLFVGSTLLTDMFVDDPTGDPLAAATRPSGVVDRAGVVRQVPFELHATLLPFADEVEAESALRANTIDGYFVIEPDYLATGRVTRVSRQTALLTGGNTQRINALLRANLTDDQQLAARLAEPLTVEREAAPGSGTAAGSPLGDGVALALAMLLAYSILSGGGSLVQAIAEEKENRTIEVVLTSVRPWQFMAGKLAGLGTLALVQLGVWMLLGGAASVVGGSLLAGGVAPPPEIWLWLLVYFVLGYLFYGGLLAAVGALGATARESGQIAGLLVIPLILPLVLRPAFDEGAGALGVALSVVPFTAPVSAIMQLVRGELPAWQLALSLVAMLVGVVFSLWLAARLFRATTLLSGTRPTPRALWQAIRG